MNSLPRPVLIGGCPGAGKTTVSRLLSAALPHSACIETDQFFDYVQDLIHPAEPASQRQNEVVITAYCEAARAFAEGGYAVFLEGVLGPWFLPLSLRVLGEVDYVLLHTTLENAQKRVADRDLQEVSPEVVAKMHSQFERHKADFEHNFVMTTGRTTTDIVAEVLTDLGGDRFRRAGG